MSTELKPLIAAIHAAYGAQAESKHSVLGPSSAYKWTACPAAIAMEQLGKYEDKVGSAARKGTFQHFVSAYCLLNDHDAADFIGYTETVEGEEFTFDKSMAETCQIYIDTVRQYVGDTGTLFVEQSVDISWITGEEGAIGTADAIIIRDGELTVVDLKTGQNNVESKDNDQLTIYAAAALKAYQDGKLKNNPSLIEKPVTQPAPADDADDLC